MLIHQICSNLLEKQKNANIDQNTSVITTDSVIPTLHLQRADTFNPDTQQQKLEWINLFWGENTSNGIFIPEHRCLSPFRLL